MPSEWGGRDRIGVHYMYPNTSTCFYMPPYKKEKGCFTNLNDQNGKTQIFYKYAKSLFITKNYVVKYSHF